jgi:HEAT repeat protein
MPRLTLPRRIIHDDTQTGAARFDLVLAVPLQDAAMPADIQSHANGDARPGLPPVTAPSGKFIVQLFVVPSLIVVGILGVLVPLVIWMSRPSRPDVLLADLRNSNPDVRWRAAEHLAQILPRDCKEDAPRLAFDAKFALDLAEELRKAIKTEEDMLADLKGKSREERPKDFEKLDAQQNLIRFLCGSLGFFNVPVTASLLCEIASKAHPPEDKVLLERRQLAIMALGNLGNNRQYFPRLPEARRQDILDQLRQLSDAEGDRGKWAKAALNFLADGEPMGVETALVACTKADDPYMRKLAALALSFWDDPEADDALDALTYDDGHGSESDRQATYQREIRYHAVVALARRGSTGFEKHPRWFDTLGEMLDEESQLKNFRIRIDNKDVPDETAARAAVHDALNGLAELHRKQPSLDLVRFRPAIEKLSNSNNEALHDEARRILSNW